MKDDNFLSRWSRRKLAAKETPATPPASTPAAPTLAEGPAVPAAAQAETQSLDSKSPAPLPPVESLTFDSDFTAFMKPDVDPGLRREALKTLLKDPRFNVMDGLDVYIDDYSKPDPLPEGWLEKMSQVKYLGHYIAPEETAQAVLPPAAESPQKAVPEQPVEPPPAVEGPDTPSVQISPPQVGKSPPLPEGDPDVLV
jgi:hypothetical protein